MATALTSAQKSSLATMTSQLQAASKQLSSMQAAKSSGGSSGGSSSSVPSVSGYTGTDVYKTKAGTVRAPSQEAADAYFGGSSGNSTKEKSAAPDKNMRPGDTGGDVEQLQKWLVQSGYLSPDQVGAGAGVYGPQTTAAVAKLQQDLGLQPSTGKGFYGPQTQAALKQKYQTAFNNLKDKPAPDQASQGLGAVQGAVQGQESSDPVFGAMASTMAPIMSALTQVLNNINNPAVTGVSLQQEYNTLAQQAGIPQMQTDMLNMQRIMNGTEDDIRDEVTKAGGTATESQVLALAASRNKVILKQYNALATNYQAATTNVQNMMQYASSDQSVALQKQNMAASITESMASISTQMMTMGMTMQQHAADNLNKVVTNVGYSGLAAQAKDNPSMLSYYEKLLGLSSGSLSNPESLSKLETMRQQQLALGQQRVQIQMYNAGLSSGGGSSTTPGGYMVQPGTGKQALVATNAEGKDSQGRPYSLTANQGQNLLKGGASIDPGTKNIVVPGIGYYVAQGDGSYRLSIDPNSDEGKYIQYKNVAENPPAWEPAGSLSNQRMTRNALTRQVNAALKQYTDSPIYKNVSQGATYLARIQAAMTRPGSVADLELADSIIKINNGGNQVTEAQINTYFKGQSLKDKFAVIDGKLTAKGGVFSPQQRQDLQILANETFSNYRDQYQKLYFQAMQNLENQGIPAAFWGNMPDFTSFLTTQ